MNVVIVDDIRLARSELAIMLQEYKNINIVGQASNGQEGLALIQQQKPDLLFLDISMPGMTGIELLERLDYKPKVIFTTAHEEHALKSYEFNTIDYLLKPITEDKLAKAIEKVFWDSPDIEVDSPDSKPEPFNENSKVLVKTPHKCMLIDIQDILRFESDGNYTQVITVNDKAAIHRALSKIEERLPSNIFFRANRQQIINLKKTDNIEVISESNSYKITMTDGTVVDIARRQASKMRSTLGL